MKRSCKFGEASWCSFKLSVNVENLSKHGGGVVNARTKYPPDASGGYNNKQDIGTLILFHNLEREIQSQIWPPQKILGQLLSVNYFIKKADYQ